MFSALSRRVGALQISILLLIIILFVKQTTNFAQFVDPSEEEEEEEEERKKEAERIDFERPANHIGHNMAKLSK